ncbi:MAG: hypothetical protein FJ104_09285, partial [Deltaproteobacteria bacterium]|nr:hypothetical protein [Deltaproteobacteria bacterium]
MVSHPWFRGLERSRDSGTLVEPAAWSCRLGTRGKIMAPPRDRPLAVVVTVLLVAGCNASPAGPGERAVDGGAFDGCARHAALADAAPGTGSTDAALPEGAAQDAATQDAATQDAATQDAATQDAATQDAATQ